MNRGLGSLILAVSVIGGLLAFTILTLTLDRPMPAAALPDYSAKTGQACGVCHVNPAGGGPLTLRGQAFAAIPTHTADPLGAFLQSGGPPTPIPLPKAAYLPSVLKDPTPTMAVLSSTAFTYTPGGSNQYLVVIGELQNISGQYRTPGIIQIVFYNSSDGIVGVRNAIAFNDVLAPADRTSFRYETTDIPPGWVRYEFNLLPSQISSYILIRLSLTEVNTTIDGSGRLHFLGAVTNDDTGGHSGFPKIYATLYDSHGAIKNAGYGTLYVFLQPGAKAFFDISINGPAEYATYEVKAYFSSTYSPTPTRTPTWTATPTPAGTRTPTPSAAASSTAAPAITLTPTQTATPTPTSGPIVNNFGAQASGFWPGAAITSG